MSRASKLVGRGQELEVAIGALHDAQNGKGRAVILHGEAGMGKTEILEHLIGLAQEWGVAVGRTRVNRLDSQKPFGALVDALRLPGETLDTRLSTVARLLRKPVPHDLGPGDTQLRSRIIIELTEHIRQFSHERPMLLAIDDANWTDLPSVMALQQVSLKLDRLPVLLVLCYRPVPLGEEQQRFLQSLTAHEAILLSLPGLDESGQLELAEAVLGARSDSSVLQKISVTRGNPLFLTILLEEMAREGSIQITDGEARVVKPFAPASLEQTILLRFTRLSQHCQRILRVASILGCTFSAGDLSTLFDENVASLLPFLAEAYEAGILAESGSELSFRHEPVREVLYDNMPSSVRRALHADAARRLSLKGAPAIRIAAHYSLGASPGDREAVTWLRRAAREICAKSPETAVKLLESALDLNEDSVEDRIEILRQMLNLLALTGEPQQAESLARELLSFTQHGSSVFSVKRDLATALWRQGRREEAAGLLRDLLADPDLSHASRARTLAELASLEMKFHRNADAAVGLALEARALGKKFDDSLAVGMALHVLGRRAWWRGQFARGAALHASAIRMAEKDSQEMQSFSPHQRLAMCLIELDRFEEAHRALDTGLAILEELGEKAAYSHDYHATYAYLYTLIGRWNEALTRFGIYGSGVDIDPQGRREALEAAMSLRIYVAIHADDLNACRRIMEGPGQSIDKVVKALYQQARGGLQAAREILSGLTEENVSTLPIYSRLVWPEAIKLAVDLEVPTAAKLLMQQTERVATLNKVASARGAFLRATGLLTGEFEPLEAAISEYRAGERAFETACTFEEAGMAAHRLGNQQRAREHLVEAINRYEGVGAERDLRRAEALGRELGIARGIRTRRRHATRGWKSLTRTERKILELIAEGMSNKAIAQHLYISPRTVETHVMHILRKLSLKSRAEAAAAFRRTQTGETT